MMAGKFFRRIPALTRTKGTQAVKLDYNLLSRLVKRLATRGAQVQENYSHIAKRVRGVRKETDVIENVLQTLADELSSLEKLFKSINAKFEADELRLVKKRQKITEMQEHIVELQEQISQLQRRQTAQQTSQLGTVDDRIMNLKNKRDQLEKEIESIQADIEELDKQDADTEQQLGYIQATHERLLDDHREELNYLANQLNHIQAQAPKINRLKPNAFNDNDEVWREFLPTDEQYNSIKEILQQEMNEKECLQCHIEEQRREKASLYATIIELCKVITLREDEIFRNKWQHFGYPLESLVTDKNKWQHFGYPLESLVTDKNKWQHFGYPLESLVTDKKKDKFSIEDDDRVHITPNLEFLSQVFEAPRMQHTYNTLKFLNLRTCADLYC